MTLRPVVATTPKPPNPPTNRQASSPASALSSSSAPRVPTRRVRALHEAQTASASVTSTMVASSRIERDSDSNSDSGSDWCSVRDLAKQERGSHASFSLSLSLREIERASPASSPGPAIGACALRTREVRCAAWSAVSSARCFAGCVVGSSKFFCIHWERRARATCSARARSVREPGQAPLLGGGVQDICIPPGCRASRVARSCGGGAPCTGWTLGGPEASLETMFCRESMCRCCSRGHLKPYLDHIRVPILLQLGPTLPRAARPDTRR